MVVLNFQRVEWAYRNPPGCLAKTQPALSTHWGREWRWLITEGQSVMRSEWLPIVLKEMG